MRELEPTSAKPPAAGVRVFTDVNYCCAFFPVLWSVFNWSVSWWIPRDKVDSFGDTADFFGAVCVLAGLVLGLNHVTWKHMESRWLRWFVFGPEDGVGAFIVYAVVFPDDGVPP